MEVPAVPEDPEERWKMFLEEVDEHLSRLKERFKDDPEMLKLLQVVEKIKNGDFEFTWRKDERKVIVEGIIELTHERDVVPSKEAIREYFLAGAPMEDGQVVGGYPAIIFLVFLKRLEKLFDNDKLAVRAKDFNVLRTTIHNLELLGSGYVPETIEMSWKGRKGVIRLPLKIEVEGETMPTDLWGMTMFIAENLDKVLNAIESMLIEI